jgi:ATP-dependent Clp protease ATP-binding subunit ClpB
LTLIEEEIVKLQKEIADYDEIWKAEKAQAQGSARSWSRSRSCATRSKSTRARATSTRWPSCNTASCPSWKSSSRKRRPRKYRQGPPLGWQTAVAAHQVGAEEIAEVVARATGIPVAKLMQGERDKLLVMEGKLHERVVGQDEAIGAVANAIRRSRSGLSTRTGPRARSCSSALRAWARPSCARRWPTFCLTAKIT